MSLLWQDCTAAEVQAAAARDALLIVPVASLEQHGPHLCTGTDILLGGAVARGIAEELAAMGVPALVTPVVWTGLAEHHMGFGGTVTLDATTLLAVLRGILRSAARQGFRRAMLLNGHGGNSELVGTAAIELSNETGMRVAGGTYWQLAPEAIAALLEAQPHLMHACEAETSMVWHLHPAGVRPERLGSAHGPMTSRLPGQPAALTLRRPYRQITETGVVGDARRASPEKGAKLLAAITRRGAEILANPALWEPVPGADQATQ